MTYLSVLGDPDRLSSFLDSIIAAGNAISVVQLTGHKATYLIGYYSTGPVVNNYILLESGDYMLLESGDMIIL
jgi:hypothetical protein